MVMNPKDEALQCYPILYGTAQVTGKKSGWMVLDFLWGTCQWRADLSDAVMINVTQYYHT